MDVADGSVFVPEGEMGGAVEHLAEVDCGIGAGQLDREKAGFGKGFANPKLDDLEDVPCLAADEVERDAQIGLSGYDELPVLTALTGLSSLQSGVHHF